MINLWKQPEVFLENSCPKFCATCATLLKNDFLHRHSETILRKTTYWLIGESFSKERKYDFLATRNEQNI